MDIRQEALQFAQMLQGLYLEQRDMTQLLAYIDEQTTWIGTGPNELCKNITEAQAALFKEKDEYKGGFTVLNSWYETVLLPEKSCIVYGEYTARANDADADVEPLHNRVSAVFSYNSEGMQLVHLHMSHPDENIVEGEYYAKAHVKLDNNTLRGMVRQTQQDLNERNSELAEITRNVAAGVYRCRDDTAHTLVHINDGFLALFGYSREELQALFQNQMIHLIYAADREQVWQSLQSQLAASDTVELEYRALRKDGTIFYVLDRVRRVLDENGETTFFCVLIDNTERRQEQEKLRLSLERHRVIMDQATDIIFQWDMQADTADISPNWIKKFGYAPQHENLRKTLPNSKVIYAEDLQTLVALMREMLSGKSYAQTELRIRKADGAYIWCRIRVTTQYDTDARPISAIGVITDISGEKEAHRALLERTQRDTLTDLLNKSAVRQHVETILREQSTEQHAMLILDIDNFKAVNDTFGHLCGDDVLLALAHGLKRVFRQSDVLGRIGGDEFLLFLPSITHEKAREKAQEALSVFLQTDWPYEEKPTVSIGVSYYPKHASDFLRLYACADSALYQAKASGKRSVAEFDEKRLGGVCQSFTHAKNAAQAKYTAQADSAENAESANSAAQKTN